MAEETKNEETKEEKKENSKFEKLISEIEKLSVKDLAELVKDLEDRFGVQAAAPMAVAAAAPGEAAAEEEQSALVDIVITDSGAKKIEVIKAIREINQEIGLKEAKDMTDNVPAEVAKEVKREEAEEMKKKLETAGAKVELK
ncbi:MAG: 50S ribosomal protein L7/L12 [Patescibacteria group bacterium]|nr:50S ribosomal protein L7/L12 [Patescibacteria group bacterium]